MPSGEIYILGESPTKNSPSYVGVYCVEESVCRLRCLGVPYTQDNRSNDGGISGENLLYAFNGDDATINN